MSTLATVHLRITGRVQGVGYRAWLMRTARKLGLSGWVRNLTDGSVEAMAQGAQDQVTQLIADCHAGPPLARVTAVDSAPVADAASFAGFEQRDTATPS